VTPRDKEIILCTFIFKHTVVLSPDGVFFFHTRLSIQVEVQTIERKNEIEILIKKNSIDMAAIFSMNEIFA